MKYKIFALLLGMAATAGLALSASAAQTHEVPVTLTVVNTQQRISVTVPASLPVSAVDGVVVTATNAAVRNTAEEGAVRIAAVTVNDGTLTVGDYENFDDASGNTIALELNGCPTRGAGALTITEEAFPAIEAGEALTIQYQARVGDSGEACAVQAATLVYIIAAAE